MPASFHFSIICDPENELRAMLKRQPGKRHVGGSALQKLGMIRVVAYCIGGIRGGTPSSHFCTVLSSGARHTGH